MWLQKSHWSYPHSDLRHGNRATVTRPSLPPAGDCSVLGKGPRDYRYPRSNTNRNIISTTHNRSKFFKLLFKHQTMLELFFWRLNYSTHASEHVSSISIHACDLLHSTAKHAITSGSSFTVVIEPVTTTTCIATLEHPCEAHRRHHEHFVGAILLVSCRDCFGWARAL